MATQSNNTKVGNRTNRRASNQQTGLAKATAKASGDLMKGGNSSNTQSVPNFWVRRGDGTAITIDPYKEVKGINSINSGVDGSGNGFSNKFDLSFAKGLTSATGILGKVVAGIKTAAQVKKAFDTPGSVFDKISSFGGISKDVLAGFNIKEGSALYNQIVAGTNTVVTLAKTGRRIENVDWSNIQSISGLLADYTKDNELFKISDLGAETAFAAKLINEATRNGIPNSFSKLTEVVSNSSVLKNALGEIMPVTMAMADMSGLKDIVKYFGSDEMKTMFPSFHENLTSAYKRQFWDNEKDTDRYRAIRDVQDAYDPNWWKTNRGSETILNVEHLLQGNAEFMDVYLTGLNVLETKGSERKLLSIFKLFNYQDVESRLRRDFPKTLFKKNLVYVQPL